MKEDDAGRNGLCLHGLHISLNYCCMQFQEKLTLEEENVLGICMAKAVGSLAIGACVASGVVWRGILLLFLT